MCEHRPSFTIIEEVSQTRHAGSVSRCGRSLLAHTDCCNSPRKFGTVDVSKHQAQSSDPELVNNKVALKPFVIYK